MRLRRGVCGCAVGLGALGWCARVRSGGSRLGLVWGWGWLPLPSLTLPYLALPSAASGRLAAWPARPRLALAGRLAQLAGWLWPGWLAGWLGSPAGAGWLAGWHWLAGSAGWLARRLAGWLARPRLVGRPAASGRLAGWLGRLGVWGKFPTRH